jgi:hypothetical protein
MDRGTNVNTKEAVNSEEQFTCLKLTPVDKLRHLFLDHDHASLRAIRVVVGRSFPRAVHRLVSTVFIMIMEK